MQKLSFIFPFLLLVLFSCNKKKEEDCSITPEHNLVVCEAADTVTSINGFTVIYYDNGVDKKSEGNFTNGVRTGFWKYYFESGDLMREGNYTDGRANGFWNVFYPNGNIRSNGEYKTCERHGFWKYYYESENYAVQYEGNYDNDSKKDTWKMYTLSGELETEYKCP